MARGDIQFKVLERIWDNTYKLERGDIPFKGIQAYQQLSI